MDDDRGKYRRMLACLGDPSRFRVVVTLLEGDRCVTEIAGEVGLSQPCTSRHLQALTREGIVIRTRAGKRVMYQLAVDCPELGRLIEGLRPLDRLAPRRPVHSVEAMRTVASAAASREPRTITDRMKDQAAEREPESQSAPLDSSADTPEESPAGPRQAGGDIEDFLL